MPRRRRKDVYAEALKAIRYKEIKMSSDKLSNHIVLAADLQFSFDLISN